MSSGRIYVTNTGSSQRNVVLMGREDYRAGFRLARDHNILHLCILTFVAGATKKPASFSEAGLVKNF